jgi:hypothetical protein
MTESSVDTNDSMQKLTFIFLPGSLFDFGWFRFMSPPAHFRSDFPNV